MNLKTLKKINYNGAKLKVYDGFPLFVLNGKYLYEHRVYAIETQKLIEALLNVSYSPRELWNITHIINFKHSRYPFGKDITLSLVQHILPELGYAHNERFYFRGGMNYLLTIFLFTTNKQKFREFTFEEIKQIFDELKDEDAYAVCFRRWNLVIYSFDKTLKMNKTSKKALKLMDYIRHNAGCHIITKSELINVLPEFVKKLGGR